MKIHIPRILLTLSFFSLISCMSESNNESTFIDLFNPASDRQILAQDDAQMRVDISINANNAQTFFFGANSPTLTANVTGVQVGESNFITLKWFEIIHGYEVEISEQSQHFIADGNTQISSTHTHTQFDYDKDGMSNFDERSIGDCVWSATENCRNTGQLDIPTDNALLNGDFSSGNDYWFAYGSSGETVDGEFCVDSPASAEFYWEAGVGYLPRVFIESATRYTVEFDVRAQKDTDIRFQLLVPELNSLELVAETVAVSTSSERKTVTFENSGNSRTGVSFIFGIGNGEDIGYCFDNIRLIRES